MNNMYDILARINLLEGKAAKPDFLDLDRDGNKTEPMKGAAKAVDEASTGDYSAKKARAGKDIGKPGKNFEKIAKSAGERYGSKERGEKVAGAVLAKLRAKESVGEGNDGNLANNAKPYDKVTRGDVIAGRLGKDAMGGKAKKKVKEESTVTSEVYTTPNGNKYKYVHRGLDDKAVLVYPGGKINLTYDYNARGYDMSDSTASDPAVTQLVRSFGFIEKGDEDEAFDDLIDRIMASKSRLGESSAKAKKHVKKESLQLVKVLEGHGRRAQVMLDTEYNEYQVRFVAEGREAGLEFTEVAADAVRWANQWVAEGTVTHTPKGLIHRGSYGTEYQGDDDEGDDTPRAKKSAGEKRAAGRPKGTGRKLGARGPSGKSKLMTREAGPADEPVEPDMDADDKRFDDMDESALQAYLGKKKYGAAGMKALQQAGRAGASQKKMAAIRAKHNKMDECADDPEYGQEGDMAKDDLRSITMAAKELHNILGDDQDLPEWVQSKITKALDYINSSNQYMKRERDDMDSNMGGNEEPIAEKAVSVKQRRAAGIAHAAQKGEIPKSELRGASKEMAKISKGELHKFAATKEKGLPDKKGKKEAKEEVEETTVAGSVATTDAGPKGKKGMQFGKGIYEARLEESYRAELARQLTESVNVNMSISSEGQKSLNVTATDDDAVALGELLKMAGLMQDSDSGSSGACPACGAQHGMHEAGCSGKMVEEGELANNPEPEYADTNTMVNTLSGGLNGRKTTGQTTIPVLQRDPARQGNPAVAEQRLWNMYKKYSG